MIIIEGGYYETWSNTVIHIGYVNKGEVTCAVYDQQGKFLYNSKHKYEGLDSQLKRRVKKKS